EKRQRPGTQHGKLERIDLPFKAENFYGAALLLFRRIFGWALCLQRCTLLTATTSLWRRGVELVQRLLHLGDRGLFGERHLLLTTLAIRERPGPGEFRL